MNQAVINGNLTLDFGGYEAVNALCSNLTFAGRNMQRIVVTSCEANDGKSFVAIQIAVCMARRAKNVLLVDADLRLSEMIRHYEISLPENFNGLAHYLSGQCVVEDILYETNYPHLYYLPSGRDVKTPLPLLTSQDFSQLMETLGYSFDMVIVDTPPIGVVIDAAEIARNCDGSVMVLEYNKTHRRTLKNALVQMERTGTPIIGCVLNKISLNRLFAKSYYYHYGSEYGGYSRQSKGKKKGFPLFGLFGSLFKKGEKGSRKTK